MFDVKIDLSGLDARLKPLHPGGQVQLFIDTEFIMQCDPYVPFDTGMLKDSAWFHSNIGHGKIIYDTPYAERMYTHPEFNFRGEPTRGAEWAARMWADRGDKIMEGAAKIAGGKAK